MESLSDIETSNFKALLTYHFLILLISGKPDEKCVTMMEHSAGTAQIINTGLFSNKLLIIFSTTKLLVLRSNLVKSTQTVAHNKLSANVFSDCGKCRLFDH